MFLIYPQLVSDHQTAPQNCFYMLYDIFWRNNEQMICILWTEQKTVAGPVFLWAHLHIFFLDKRFFLTTESVFWPPGPQFVFFNIVAYFCIHIFDFRLFVASLTAVSGDNIWIHFNMVSLHFGGLRAFIPWFYVYFINKNDKIKQIFCWFVSGEKKFKYLGSFPGTTPGCIQRAVLIGAPCQTLVFLSQLLICASWRT